ncbi:MerR family transcriptional regulator [Ammoniphilus sp. CFH 90114]|uniref:MerR family transcriptional regulator n=1 Tax=Ammoniphilus sp. CFH 90114 TaxID=2493665 RepID=UPI00100F33E0|nr:MerR family transcriptional regulator [Ammoniphilus sp. CFH 90114]RXT04198.1 MerR family transcriptional regulator [Ammoniphilus sp. CFH 90114]
MYRIGEIAEIAKVSKRTLDYYTQMGLLVPERSDSGYRYYNENTLERLKLIEMFKREKLSLVEIKERLDTLDSCNISAQDISKRIHEIQEQMKKLESEVLKLKPMLSKLNEKQLKTLTRQISIQGTSLYHTIAILLGEVPL